jgi:hypothetical protein
LQIDVEPHSLITLLTSLNESKKKLQKRESSEKLFTSASNYFDSLLPIIKIMNEKKNPMIHALFSKT